MVAVCLVILENEESSDQVNLKPLRPPFDRPSTALRQAQGSKPVNL
jgi:hypothetical protein